MRANGTGRRALADRKLIARATGLLMRRLRLNEAQAFRALRTAAMDRRVTIAALADALILGDQAGPLKPSR